MFNLGGVFFIAWAGCFFPAQFGQFYCSAMTTAADRCCVVFTPCELNLLLWYRLCISLTYELCVVVTVMALLRACQRLGEQVGNLPSFSFLYLYSHSPPSELHVSSIYLTIASILHWDIIRITRSPHPRMTVPMMRTI